MTQTTTVGSDPTDLIPTIPACAVCGSTVQETGADGIFQHRSEDPCVVDLTDELGSSLDSQFFVAEDGFIYEREGFVDSAPVPPDEVITAPTQTEGVPVEEDAGDTLPEPELPNVFANDQTKKKRKSKKAKEAEAAALIYLDGDPNIKSMEEGILACFDQHSQERLGGASGDLGWSSFSTYQRCPYLFKRLYLDGLRKAGRPYPALEIGSCFHTFAAVYYQKMINPSYPITPAIMHSFLVEYGVNGESLMEAWRIWQGYTIEYENDYLMPLAVEYHIIDPKTKESARYDLIAKVEQAQAGVVAGTYVVEHKTSGRFDEATLDGWRNDGEILGQIMLWNRLKLNRKFGKLQGVLVNVVGKQKMQKFHRTVVPPERWQTNQHGNDLRVWQGLRTLSMATDTWPRARANCIGRYGKCSQWKHCADREK